MTTKSDKSPSTNNKRKYFLNELESLLQMFGSSTGIPEPTQLNHFEGTGNYMVYLSKLAKRDNNDGL